jgi:hypothetical protein
MHRAEEPQRILMRRLWTGTKILLQFQQGLGFRNLLESGAVH